MPLPAGDAPDWVHLLPAGPSIETYDGRGPYRLDDPAAVVAASRAASAERGAVLDENHATDLAAPRGEAAPARGWIVDFEARPDGIWGKVDWNPSGRALMADRAYRGLSPAIVYDRANRVIAITRASLVNRGNLKNLTTLHQEETMDLLAQLAARLGLEAGASQDTVLAAVDSLRAGAATALQAQLAPIAAAAGLAAAQVHTAETILGAVTALAARAGTAAPPAALEALQAELNTVTAELNRLRDQGRRQAAEAFVDGAIRERRVGVSALRDYWIGLHTQDAAGTEAAIGKLAVLDPSHTSLVPPREAGQPAPLTAEQARAIALMGISREDYLKTLASEGRTEAAA
jgi:phage I-like protein